ncbi:hypothetical protein [Sporomusa acidovorans]|uniref:Acetyltransferase n=1 Tax=Sporomusa acidovorans (strain ATCC 49682 / DSM 3132 / Mol) TaxID=1123286 RepID=A0ABZ3J6C4_SPOA4|nr:hypothetical protein [Sporomusa acidovorans]OZC15407.1 hypothetical protein SPACI_49570 [Sporomusa acidovorans DSM 3132]SDF13214.1 hypothetical protein SAMN04488499_103416 [Sporomusa acidovorans]
MAEIRMSEQKSDDYDAIIAFWKQTIGLYSKSLPKGSSLCR